MTDDQSCGSRNDGCRLRGAATFEESCVDHGGWVLDVGRRAGNPEALDGPARSNEIDIAAVGATVGKIGDEVIWRAFGSAGIAGSHRDHVGIERWIAQSGSVAVVSGRHHHDNAAIPCHLHCVSQGIERVLLNSVGAEREVQYPDVQTVVVAMLDYPIDGRNHLRDIDRTVGIGHLDVQDTCTGSDPDELARFLGTEGIGETVAAGNDPCHMGTVPVRIQIGEILSLGLE